MAASVDVAVNRRVDRGVDRDTDVDWLDPDVWADPERWPGQDTDPLPDWVQTIRPPQAEAIVRALEAYVRGGANERGVKLVVLDAPTGTGKTLIGEGVRRGVAAMLAGRKAVYVCHGLTLQDQFLRDFQYARVLKGRANYGTQHGPWPDVTCADCDDFSGAACSWCDEGGCPYKVAKRAALGSPLAVLNTAYLLAEANSVGSLVEGGRLKLAIADECDTLESLLLGFCEVRVSGRWLTRLGVQAPPKGVRKPRIIEWMRATADRAHRWARDNAHDKKTGIGAVRLAEQLEWAAAQIEADVEAQKAAKAAGVDWDAEDGGAWLRNYDDARTDAFIMQPVLVAPYGQQMLWQHATRWLAMSGTVVSADEFVQSLGWTDEYEAISIPMSFPVENRPIVVAGVANVIRSEMDSAIPKLATAIVRIAERHPDERILVHTVSYHLARELKQRVEIEVGRRKCWTYGSARDRDAAVDNYRKHRGSIIFAPSLDRGVDFRDDDCRVQVIAKVPFPHLGDRRTSARLHLPGGQAWYQVQTVRTVMQMTGRGVRSSDDWAHCVAPHTLILTRDLRWVPAQSLRAGDEIWGFDELTSRVEPRRWRPAVVEATGIEVLERLQVNLTNGHSLIVTPNHRFISKWGQARDDKWVRADQLSPGHHLNRYLDVWTRFDDRTAGYLAGMWDGEGCLSVGVGARNRNVIMNTLVQKPGIVLDETARAMTEYGFKFTVNHNRHRGTSHLHVRGGLSEQLRLLGAIRPLRLLDKFVTSNFAARMESREYVGVVSVERLPPGPMVTLQSSTETYFTDGYASHNTYIIDKQFSSNLYAGPAKRLFPSWWRDAIDRSFNARSLMQ